MHTLSFRQVPVLLRSRILLRMPWIISRNECAAHSLRAAVPIGQAPAQCECSSARADHQCCQCRGMHCKWRRTRPPTSTAHAREGGTPTAPAAHACIAALAAWIAAARDWTDAHAVALAAVAIKAAAAALPCWLLRWSRPTAHLRCRFRPALAHLPPGHESRCGR